MIEDLVYRRDGRIQLPTIEMAKGESLVTNDPKEKQTSDTGSHRIKEKVPFYVCFCLLRSNYYSQMCSLAKACFLRSKSGVSNNETNWTTNAQTVWENTGSKIERTEE